MDNLSENHPAGPKDGSPDAIFKKMDVNHADKLSGNGAPSYSVSGNRSNEKGVKTATRMRFIVCTLGLISLALSQMSRIVLNQTITSMVHPSMHFKQDPSSLSSDGSCPWPEEANLDSLNTPSSALAIDPIHFEPTKPPYSDEGDAMTSTTTSALPDTIDDLTTVTIRDVLMTTTSVPPDTTEKPDCNTEKNKEEQLDKFMWTIKQQNVLHGGFFYSYFFFMILGGRLAEVYGAKYVLLLAVAGSALINMATPFMARNSFYLLVSSRILLGIIQSGVFPAMYALFNKWLTMTEASIYTPLIKMNLRLGMMLGSLIPGILPGWPSVYYFTGTICAIWSVAWYLVATSEPEGNRWVSIEELNHILKKKVKPMDKETDEVELGEKKVNGFKTTEEPKKKASLKTPWLKIITAPSVIALIVVKLTFNYAIDFLAVELPSYLIYVHHVSERKKSFLITCMFSIQVTLIVFVGWLAKSVVVRRPFGMSKTAIRKLFQCFTSFGIAFLMFLMTFNDCNIVFVGVLLQLISFVSMFTAGGETMLPYDLSAEFPATIMAIANSVANVSGITTTVLAGLVLGDQGGSYARWNILIYLIVGANTVGGLVFLLFAKAEPIKLDGSKKQENKQSPSVGVDVELGTKESVPTVPSLEESRDVGKDEQIKQVKLD